MAVNHTKGNKFEPTYEGPFKVIRRNKGGAYILQDTDGKTMHRNFTPSELKMISHEPDTTDPSYEVEKILDHRGKPGDYEYYVKWKGYTRADSTWEKTTQFDDISIVQKYWETLGKAQNKSRTTKSSETTVDTPVQNTRSKSTRRPPQH